MALFQFQSFPVFFSLPNTHEYCTGQLWWSGKPRELISPSKQSQILCSLCVEILFYVKILIFMDHLLMIKLYTRQPYFKRCQLWMFNVDHNLPLYLCFLTHLIFIPSFVWLLCLISALKKIFIDGFYYVVFVCVYVHTCWTCMKRQCSVYSAKSCIYIARDQRKETLKP